jgi:hypothetical protein
MENLAGRQEYTNCDTKIPKELAKAGIDIVVHPSTLDHSEVRTRYTGKLGDFIFERAWYYWVVEGEVPLEVAKELYENPNGAEDIRVDGDCGCPSPEERVKYYDKDGKKLLPLKEEKGLKRLEKSAEKEPGCNLEKLCKEMRESIRFVEDPAKEAVRSVIALYHIDTQEGLNFFTETLRKHKLVPVKE